ncbi:hypothetical protein GCM10025777_13490 [Membranihabitans marinus]
MDISSPQYDGYIENPSLIVFSDGHRLNIGGSTGYLHFGINHYSLYTSMTTKSSDGITAGIQGFGTTFYKEYSISLSYNKKLGPVLAIGIEQKYQGNSIPGHENRSATVTHILGSIILNNYSFSLGIERSFGLKSYRASQDMQYTIGSHLKINKEIAIYLKGQYTSPELWHSGLGIQNQLYKNIDLYLSIQIHPIIYGLGLRLPVNSQFYIDISNQFQSFLGHHFALGIQWIWNKTDKEKSQLSILPL